MDARSASTGRGSRRDLDFPRAGRRLPRLLHVYIATARRPNPAPSVVFVDAADRILDRIPLDRNLETGVRRALRGIVSALWKARRLGYRRIAVHVDDSAAVAQVNGDRPIEADAVGLYLETRALLHLYTSAHIDVGELRVFEPVAPGPPPAEPAKSAVP